MGKEPEGKRQPWHQVRRVPALRRDLFSNLGHEIPAQGRDAPVEPPYLRAAGPRPASFLDPRAAIG